MKKRQQAGLHTSKVHLGETAGVAWWRASQEVPTEFLEQVRAKREHPTRGDMRHVASVPQIVWDELYRMGIDPVRLWKDNPQELLSKLEVAQQKVNPGLAAGALRTGKW